MNDINASILNLKEGRANLEKQGEAIEKAPDLNVEKEDIVKRIVELRSREFVLRKEAEEESAEMRKQQILLEAANVSEEVKNMQAMLEKVNTILADYNVPEETAKNFDKHICFSNIRELLKESQMDIGQFEKEAGCSQGEMSRLDELNNTADPSVEFLVTAAKLLGTSLDTLVSFNLTELTATEKYLVTFFEKLNTDTLADKLDWNKETVTSLERMEADMNGNVHHPLFSVETFFEEREHAYPEEVTRVVFTSNSFGPGTVIAGDCFHLRMKNNSYLYLMDVSKSVHRVDDPDALAKEIWMYVPGSGSYLLACNRAASPLAPLVNTVFATVSECMKHPRLKKELQFVIDAFLHDDVGNDNTESPF